MKTFHPLLGIISDEVSQDYDRVVAFAREFQLDGIEIRSVEGKAFKDLTPADADLIGRKTKDAGLRIAGAATPTFKCALEDKSAIEDHIEGFRRALDMALAWECPVIRVFTFLRREEPTREDDLKKAAEHLHRLVEIRGDAPVTIGVENEATTLVCTGQETRKIMGLLPLERVGVVWDPCNILFIPGTSQPGVEDFAEVEERIIHFHVKDANRENGKAATHCVEVGKGDVDYSSQFRRLHERGYNGWITLETHWRMQPLTAEQAHLPAGYAFSANAEEPSRICMKNLKAMLQEVAS